MTVTEMVQRVKDRTHQTDDTKVINELNGAQSWAFNRIYNSEGGPDLLVTIDEEKTLSGSTRTYNLDTYLTYSLMGLKKLWLKLPTDTQFTPMHPLDSTSPIFAGFDVLSSSETVVSGHPVYYYVENFSTLRFSGLLPTNSVLRVDYFRVPPPLDPSTNDTLTNGLDLPAPTHEALVDYATAEIWDMLDDDRAIPRMQRAIARLDTATYTIQARVKGPTRTTPYSASRRRTI